MTHGHAFWFTCTWACVAWYTAITFYVAVRGAVDIRDMLRQLKNREPPPDPGISEANRNENPEP